ncbi:MAG TPA: DUF1259 domain-containing protein [Gemmatimonadaceae bacterium]
MKGLAAVWSGSLIATAAVCCGPRPERAGEGALATTIDWTAVDSALGRTGAVQPGDVRRFGMPRGDLRVSAHGVALRPAFALGSWIAFKAHGDGAVAAGDLVLTEDELGPVIRRLQEGGVEQTAVHHHITHESPRVLYVHLHAHGDPLAIASTVRGALALTGTPPEGASTTPSAIDLDTAAVANALGYDGRVTGGVVQFSVPRGEVIRSDGMDVPPSMGLGTAINFQPTGDGRAAITGDFVLLGSEVNRVIRALNAHGIDVTSLHSHMLSEEPRLFFMHFWAVDDAMTLARGLRAGLELTNSRPSTR